MAKCFIENYQSLVPVLQYVVVKRPNYLFRLYKYLYLPQLRYHNNSCNGFITFFFKFYIICILDAYWLVGIY